MKSALASVSNRKTSIELHLQLWSAWTFGGCPKPRSFTFIWLWLILPEDKAPDPSWWEPIALSKHACFDLWWVGYPANPHTPFPALLLASLLVWLASIWGASYGIGEIVSGWWLWHWFCPVFDLRWWERTYIEYDTPTYHCLSFSFTNTTKSKKLELSLSIGIPSNANHTSSPIIIIMSSPTYTQFHTLTHPQHAHRHGSISSTTSTSSTGSNGPIFSSAYRRDSIAAPVSTRPRRASEADPFAAHRDTNYNPFESTIKPRRGSVPLVEPLSTSPTSTSPTEPSPPVGMQRDRRMSREWDASKVPPSKFQRPEGKAPIWNISTWYG